MSKTDEWYEKYGSNVYMVERVYASRIISEAAGIIKELEERVKFLTTCRQCQTETEPYPVCRQCQQDAMRRIQPNTVGFD